MLFIRTQKNILGECSKAKLGLIGSFNFFIMYYFLWLFFFILERLNGIVKARCLGPPDTIS